MSFITKLLDIVKSIFGSLPSDLKEDAAKALTVTKGIRAFLTSPAGDILTAIIPGTWDDSLRNEIIAALNKAIPTLQILNDCNDKQGAELVECYVNELSKYTTDVQEALLKKLADLITMLIHNGELTADQAAVATQIVYSKMKHD